MCYRVETVSSSNNGKKIRTYSSILSASIFRTWWLITDHMQTVAADLTAAAVLPAFHWRKPLICGTIVSTIKSPLLARLGMDEVSKLILLSWISGDFTDEEISLATISTTLPSKIFSCWQINCNTLNDVSHPRESSSSNECHTEARRSLIISATLG